MTSVVIHCTARNLTLDVSDGKSRLKTTISWIAVRACAILELGQIEEHAY